MFCKIAAVCALATVATAGNFGDLSFLNSEGDFKAAMAKRAKWVKQHLKNVAHRRHQTIKYFKAKHWKARKAKWAKAWDMRYKKSVMAARKAAAHHKKAQKKHARAHKSMHYAKKQWMHARHMRMVWGKRAAAAKRNVRAWAAKWRSAKN